MKGGAARCALENRRFSPAGQPETGQTTRPPVDANRFILERFFKDTPILAVAR
jgi:hypothetical protein